MSVGMIQCDGEAPIATKATEIEHVAMELGTLLKYLLSDGTAPGHWDSAASIAVRCLDVIEGLADEIKREALPTPAVAEKPKRAAKAVK